MATYFESGVGKAILHSDSANSAELGRLAATEALAQIKRFQPSLALAFVSPELELAEVSKGINDVLDGCPLIGTSTAGEIAVMALKQKDGAPPPQEEDIVLAETISKLTASGLHRIELDGRLGVKSQQLEILNQLGHELSKTISTSSQSQNIVKHVRRILNLSFASLWLVDRTHQLLVKEAIDGNGNIDIGEVEKENDERLAKWQIDHQAPFFHQWNRRTAVN